jgi:heat shock protein HslJ
MLAVPRAVVLPLAITVIGLVGCSPSDPPAEGLDEAQVVAEGAADKTVAVLAEAPLERSPDASDLVGTWLLEDLGGRGVVDMVQTTIEFEADGRASGNGGCNRFTGSYVFEGGGLTFGPLAGTKRMCPEAMMDQEDRFHRALGAAASVTVDGPFLLIYFDGSDKPLKFTRMEPEVFD